MGVDWYPEPVEGDQREPRFGAVVTAMVTPFDGAGALDVDAAVQLARWLVDHGTDGLVVAGTTGEGAVLDDAERFELWRAVAEAVTVPVVAGAGSNDTRHSIGLARAATEAGVDALLLVTPYYSRPSQRGIAEHFTAVSAASHLPVLLYDIPVRSGRRIELDTMLHLAKEVPNIVGVKDAAGDVAGTARLVAAAPPSFEVYCGDDLLTLPLLAVGAVGAVSVASHWVGAGIGEMIDLFRKSDVAGARARNAELLDAVSFQSSAAWPNPLPAKALLRALGLRVGQCRPPMGTAPPELDERAGGLARRLHLSAPADDAVA